MTSIQQDAALKAFDDAARDMETTYSTVMNELSDTLKAYLVVEQGYWLQYKEARFKALQALYGLLSTGPHTLDREALLAAQTAGFTARTADLKKFLSEAQTPA